MTLLKSRITKEKKYKILILLAMIFFWSLNLFLLIYKSNFNDNITFLKCVWLLFSILSTAPIIVGIIFLFEEFVENWLLNRTFKQGENKKSLTIDGITKYYKTITLEGEEYMYRVCYVCYDSDPSTSSIHQAQHEGIRTMFFKNKKIIGKKPKFDMFLFSSSELVDDEIIDDLFCVHFNINTKKTDDLKALINSKKRKIP